MDLFLGPERMATYPGGDIVVKQGAGWSEVLTYRDQDGNLVDFTGASAKMDVRTPAGALGITLSTTNGKITLGGTAGTLTRALAAADTQGLTPGQQYNWDLYVTLAGGAVVEPLEGTFVTIARVTQ